MKHPKTLTVLEQHQLLAQLKIENGTAAQFQKSMRNLTMATLMLETGIRVGEMIKLRFDDLYWNDLPVKSLFIREEIAKNHSAREVPVSSRLNITLLNYRSRIVAGVGYVPIQYAFFLSSPEHHIGTRQVERIIKGAALSAFGRPCHPHMLRHTFGTKLMRVTDIRTVQTLLGHKHITSTQVYTHPSREDLSTAIERMG